MDINLEKILEDLLKRRWVFYVNRRFNWYTEETQIRANSKKTQMDLLGFSLACQNYLILDGYEYGLPDDGEKNAKYLEDKFQKDLNFFLKFKEKIMDIVAETDGYRDYLEKENFDGWDAQKLKMEHQKFFAAYLRSFVPSWSRPDEYLQEKLIGIIKKRTDDEKEQEEIFSAIAVCPGEKLPELMYVSEPIDLALIAKKIVAKKYDMNELPADARKDIDNHAKKYAWLKGPVGMEKESFTLDDYHERLKELVKKDIDSLLENIEITRQGQEEKYLAVVEKYQFSPEEKKISEAVRDFIFLRTYSTEACDRLFYSARMTLFEAVAKYFGVFSDDIAMLSCDEIDRYLSQEQKDLNTDEARTIIGRRRQSFSIVWLDGKVSVYAGEESAYLTEKIRDRFLQEDKDVSQVAEIKGSIGSKGLATGRVCVVLGASEAHKMKEGDILVSSMTTPDIISAMEKAAAFVTDEGGITCHAAIVAREFKKPCIIGTRIATQVLKDGDMVEVDASEGVVRILR